MLIACCFNFKLIYNFCDFFKPNRHTGTGQLIAAPATE